MKYVPGPAFGQFSRSQGNTTASHNRFGSYLRNRTIPVNPNTALQTTQRNNLAELSSDYKNLTSTQRAGWASLGLQMIRLDSQGQSYTLTGLQAFTSINRYRRLAGQADLSDAPLFENPDIVTTLTPTFSSGIGGMDLAFTPTPIGATRRLIVEATRGVSAGIDFMPRSEYKIMSVGALDEASPVDFTTAWEAAFGTRVVGQKVFARARVVTESGFAGVPLNTSSVMT